MFIIFCPWYHSSVTKAKHHTKQFLGMTSPRRASTAPISPAVPPSPTHSLCLLGHFWLRVSFSPSPRLPLPWEAVDLCDESSFFSNYTRTHLNGKRFFSLFPSLLVIWQVLENPVINNLCRKTDDVLRSQKVIFSRTQLFEHFPDAPRQSSCVRVSQLVFQPGHCARRAGLPLIVTSVRWHSHPLLLFQASGNFLTTGQAPALHTNKLQIAAL